MSKRKLKGIKVTFQELPSVPELGMPCTVCHPSDRYAAKIVWMSASKHQVHVKYDHRDTTDLFTRRSNGCYAKAGGNSPRLRLGVAEDYRCREI